MRSLADYCESRSAVYLWSHWGQITCGIVKYVVRLERTCPAPVITDASTTGAQNGKRVRTAQRHLYPSKEGEVVMDHHKISRATATPQIRVCKCSKAQVTGEAVIVSRPETASD